MSYMEDALRFGFTLTLNIVFYKKRKLKPHLFKVYIWVLLFTFSPNSKKSEFTKPSMHWSCWFHQKKCVNVLNRFLFWNRLVYVFLTFFKFSGCFLMILCLYGHTVQQHMVEHTSYSMAPKDIYPKYNKDLNKTWTFAVVEQIGPSRFCTFAKVFYFWGSFFILSLTKSGA